MNDDGPRRRPIAIEAASAAALVGFNVLLYRKIFTLWWTYDDANILRSIFEHPFIAPFVDSHVWPQQLFTPLLIMAFDAQWKLFAFNATQWYAVQLAVACVTTILVYAAVRQFLDHWRSVAAAAIFAAGPPLCSVITQISTVHYYLAISFSALAVMAYVIALRRVSWLVTALSAVCYLLAMLAKEVSIPLPLLLIALPLRDLRTRLRFVVAHGVATVVYFVWRYAVIRTFFGAYGWKIDAAEWPRLLMLLPWRIVQGAAGAGTAIGLTLVGVMTLTIIAGVRNRRTIALLIAAILVAGVPMLPLAKEVNRRYVVVPWLAWSIAFSAATARRGKRAAAALLAVAPLLAIAANRQEWRHEFPLRRRMSDEARFFFYDMPPDALLRRPLAPPAAMGEVKWMKTVQFAKPAGDWFYDDIFLCGGGAGGRRVFEYEGHGIVEVTPRVAGLAARFCHSLRNAPLSATFHYRNPALYWDLGPYAGGRYSAILGNGIQAFEIPRRDALNLERGIPGLGLRIRYDSPAGWTTYSPELTLDFVHHPDLAWHR
ncbi:MAG TPA: hypothetical protein VN380_22870 [Thermoanaerobaculia bacterium]|nr:hypothetical protein [Thermoanaerobaculia bacterium]